METTLFHLFSLFLPGDRNPEIRSIILYAFASHHGKTKKDAKPYLLQF